jgi:anti-sigma factor RsiW
MNDLSRQLEEVVRWHHRRRDGGCAEEVALGRFAAGDLDPDERAAFEGHLAGCPECRLDLQRFALASREEAAAAPLERRSGQPRRLRFGRLRWAVAAVAVAAVAVLAVRLVPEPPSALHPKGVAAFQLHAAALRQGKTLRVREGVRLEPGDQVGFFYSAPRAGHLMILYAGERELVRVFPAATARSAPVAAGREVRIPDGATLSAGTGCEWFFGIWSSRSFDEAEAARRVGALRDRRRGCRVEGSSKGEVNVQVIGIRP